MLSRLRQRLTRYLDPRGRLDWGHLALIVIIIYLVGIISGVGGTKAVEYVASKPLILHTPTKAQDALLHRMNTSDFMMSGCYEPTAAQMRLPQTWAVISSEFDYDAPLLGATPCGDYDFMQPNGAENPVTLPGPAWVHYTYLWTEYIQGSGYEDTFTAPGGGHFAYLHLHYPKTYRAGQHLAGGTAVGRSGWPQSLAYSNNSCYDYNSCRVDAHLCLVVSVGAANWFYRLAVNPPAKPQPKPRLSATQVRIYEQYRHEHHKGLISYKDGHGNLLPVVLKWRTLKSSRIGGVLHAGVWHPAREGQLNRMRWSYQGGALDYYPRTGNTRVTYWKHWTR